MWFPFAIPSEDRPVYEIILCFVRFEYGKFSFSKRLLSRSDGGVIECKMEEVDVQGRDILECDPYCLSAQSSACSV